MAAPLNSKPTAEDSTHLKKRLFVLAHLEDAIAVATTLNLRPEQILGLSALESGWGTGRFALQGNNFFGLHAPALYQISTITAQDDPNVNMATFASYLASAKSFCDDPKYGQRVKNLTNTRAFVTMLQVHCKFGWMPDPKDPKHKKYIMKPTYVHDTSVTIDSLTSFIK